MKDNLSEIVLVLDRSSSMQQTKSDTIGGVNAFLEEQKRLPGEANFTMVTFSDPTHGGEIVVHKNVDINKVPNLTDETYKPHGNTALLDCIGNTIDLVGKKLEEMKEEDRPATVIFTILTDGQENASKEYSHKQILDKIQHQKDKYNWKFIFLGADENAIAVGASLGSTMSFQYDANDYSKSFKGVSMSTKLYRSTKGADLSANDEAEIRAHFFKK